MTLLQAYQSGQFLEAVSAALSESPNDRTALTSDLAAVHNEGLINVVEAFSHLESPSTAGHAFFVLQRVLEEVLPELDAPVREVMRCVLHLHQAAGADGRILGAFREFCSRQAERAKEALAEIEVNPNLLADLLAPTLIAGSHIDPLFYLDETVRLSQHQNPEIGRRAMFALGRLHMTEDARQTGSALSMVEQTVKTETDDGLLASAVRSAFRLLRQDSPNEPRYIAAIASALARGDEYTLHAASEILGYETADVSLELLDVLLAYLTRLGPSNKGTLDNIDYGIAHLLQGHHPERGLQFLEELFLAQPEELTLESLDSTIRAIRDQPALRNKALTRWLLRGTTSLRDGLDSIVDGPHPDDSLEFELDPKELDPSDDLKLIFVARKAIGYLFLKPKSVASFLVSLMEHSTSGRALEALRDLLFDPMLLNFTGSLNDYVKQRAKTRRGKVKKALRHSLRSVEKYLDDLKSTSDAPALRPSEAQREAYHRHFSQIMTASLKEAQAQSALLQLFPKTVLLYGRKAIYYMHGIEGGPSRMEVLLHGHRTEFEVPRMTILDPCGLELMLRRFRFERLTP